MLWRACNLEGLELLPWFCARGGGGGKGKKKKKSLFFSSNSQINNNSKKSPLPFLSRRHAQMNQNEEVILSQGCDSDSLLLLVLACIRKLNLEITVNSKKSQGIYYIDPSISGVYNCFVTLLMPCFKVSFLHENGAVILTTLQSHTKLPGAWTIRNLWTLAVTYFFWGRNDQFTVI